MLVYHLLWDLSDLGFLRIPLSGPVWQTISRVIGGSFLLILGISATLDHVRASSRGVSPLKHNLRRGAFVFGCGLAISVVTYIMYSGPCNCWVRFGILHLAGASIIVSQIFVRIPTPITLFLALDLLLLGFSWRAYYDDAYWLLPLGITPLGFYSIDYYPIVPWLGVVLFGVVIGKQVYPNGWRNFSTPHWDGVSSIKMLQFLGRHSLTIYPLHQPIFLTFLYGANHIKYW